MALTVGLGRAFRREHWGNDPSGSLGQLGRREIDIKAKFQIDINAKLHDQFDMSEKHPACEQHEPNLTTLRKDRRRREQVSRATGAEPGNGSKFMGASVGFRGSCLQKDVLSLVCICDPKACTRTFSIWSTSANPKAFTKMTLGDGYREDDTLQIYGSSNRQPRTTEAMGNPRTPNCKLGG